MPRKRNTPNKTSTTAGRRALVPGTQLTEVQVEFLKHLVETGGKVNVSHKLTGIGERSHYAWLEASPAYKAAHQDALAKARVIREDTVRAAIREAWEQGFDEEIIEQKMEERPDPANPRQMVMTVTEVKRRTQKKRFVNALFYEANSIMGNPARLEINTTGPTQINIESLRDLIERAESAEKVEMEER